MCPGGKNEDWGQGWQVSLMSGTCLRECPACMVPGRLSERRSMVRGGMECHGGFTRLQFQGEAHHSQASGILKDLDIEEAIPFVSRHKRPLLVPSSAKGECSYIQY